MHGGLQLALKLASTCKHACMYVSMQVLSVTRLYSRPTIVNNRFKLVCMVALYTWPLGIHCGDEYIQTPFTYYANHAGYVCTYTQGTKVMF